MNTFLKDHPFAVEAFFESSIVLTFSVPREELEKFIPECLELDVFGDKWAFVAVALVQTKDLRPKGFPRILGNDFFLIGYRIFVRYTTNEGKKLRGLYILKSETDKKKMEFFGNIFTHYKYTTTDIQFEVNGNYKSITSSQSGLSIQVEVGQEDVQLPDNSPFKNWSEARKFAGPLPFTFTYTPETKEVLIIEGVRQNWKPEAITVKKHSISFLKALQLPEIHLANAFIINNIPYYWKKGKKEKWNGKENLLRG
ncbi:MAG: hypothetical protein JWM28_2026 [Chitinophagaceae bacterium]|nr:hypothetical protein [Chitinophagaceae bacterium]